MHKEFYPDSEEGGISLEATNKVACVRQGKISAVLEHLTKCCSHMFTGEFLAKQPVRFEPLAYFPYLPILREYSTGE